MQIARQPPGISHIPGGYQQPAARGASAAPLTVAAWLTEPCGHCVNLDIFSQGTIFAREGNSLSRLPPKFVYPHAKL